jgi:tRNA A-37 threonylcarbamoyl transferase component Bud32/tetratricopeptide (TPR) repeat protein
MAPESDSVYRLGAALADRYAIEKETGSGGMATVYRARDLKHQRAVAIKVLKPDLAHAIGADRFLREIRTTANLSHPHILPLFDSGEADGFLYFVMPFVEGESLADRLAREGRLPVEDAVQIAREVADGLEHAHAHGVVHRDVKPANILLKEGHALLADFGIAQAAAGAEETKLTGSGMYLGTAFYMSPEQAAGEETLDARSDQYALGCVLFEMLTGNPPFAGAGIQGVLYQHLAVDAPRVTAARPSVPKGVASALHRALAKKPDDRYRTMEEFGAALHGATLPFFARMPMGRARAMVFGGTFVLALATAAVVASVWNPAPPLEPERVAVFPLENRTGDPALDGLGVEAADLIVVGIGWTEEWRPVSHELSAGARAEAGVVVEAARALGAGVSVSGYYTLRDSALVFRAEVVDVATGERRWSAESVSGDAAGALEDLQQRLAGGFHIASVGRPAGGSWPWPTVPRHEAAVVERRAARLHNQGEWAAAAGLHAEAYRLDSAFLLPVVNLFDTYRITGPRERADSILRFLAPRRTRLPEHFQYYVDARAAGIRGDVDGELEAWRAAAGADPPPFMLYFYGEFALNHGRPQEALEAFGKISAGAPQRATWYMWLETSVAHLWLGEHEDQLAVSREGAARFPEQLEFLHVQLYALAALGRSDEMAPLLDDLEGRTSWASSTPGAVLGMTGEALARLGYQEEARAVANRGLAWFEARMPDRYYHYRIRYLLVADRFDDALAMARTWLEGEPENPGARTFYGYLLGLGGDTAAAEAEWQRLVDHLAARGQDALGGQGLFFRAGFLAATGRLEEAVRELWRYEDEGGRLDWRYPYDAFLKPLWGYPPFEQWAEPRG